MQITPVNEYILIEPIKEKKSSLIELPDAREQFTRAKVLEGNETYKKGSTILFQYGLIEIDNMFFIKSENIIAIV